MNKNEKTSKIKEEIGKIIKEENKRLKLIRETIAMVKYVVTSREDTDLILTRSPISLTVEIFKDVRADLENKKDFFESVESRINELEEVKQIREFSKDGGLFDKMFNANLEGLSQESQKNAKKNKRKIKEETLKNLIHYDGHTTDLVYSSILKEI